MSSENNSPVGDSVSYKTYTYPLSGKAAWYGLLLVGLANALSLMDRQILAILMPRIKADLQVGDAEMGLLYGTVFALFYALFSMPLGRLADGWIRTRLLAICITLWSFMTGLSGMANSFALLAFSRLGVGIGEAAVQPAGMSLVSDLFKKEQRGTVTAIIAASLALGLGMSILAGGVIADIWDATFENGAQPLGIKGWQAAFFFAAIPGFVLAIFFAKFVEPERGVADGIKHVQETQPFAASVDTFVSILPGLNWLSFYRKSAPIKVWLINLSALILVVVIAMLLVKFTNSIREVNSIALSLGAIQLNGNELQWLVTGFGAFVILNWFQSLKLSDRPTYAVLVGNPSVFCLVALASLQIMVNYSVIAWTPSFLVRTHGLTPLEIGVVIGPLMTVTGIVGPMIAGPISDWAYRQAKNGRIFVTLFSMSLSPVLGLWAYNAETAFDFYCRFACMTLILSMWMAPVTASLLDSVLPRMRGMLMSLYTLATTIIGLGLGPYLVGLISDANGGNIGEAITSIFWVYPVIILLALLLILRLAKDEALVVERARVAGEPV